jgi:hypothetical protein
MRESTGTGLGIDERLRERTEERDSMALGEANTWEVSDTGSDLPADGSFRDRLLRVNKELWLILAMLVIAGAMNYLVTAKQMIIGFYTMPTIFSAYFFGRRHAVLTAFASVFLIGLLAHFNPLLFEDVGSDYIGNHDMLVWGGILVLTAYAMGTLYEREKQRIVELRQTYHGLLIILRQLVCKDRTSENHAFRVSVYASKIAEYRGLGPGQVEDVRAASILHDIGELETSRELLSRAARLTLEEQASRGMRTGDAALSREPAGGPIHRIVPVILLCRERYDAQGDAALGGQEIPLEARIIRVADAYDLLTTDRPGIKAVTPLEAKNMIGRESGTEFDPTVVHAFNRAFRKGELEVREPLRQHGVMPPNPGVTCSRV